MCVRSVASAAALVSSPAARTTYVACRYRRYVDMNADHSGRPLIEFHSSAVARYCTLWWSLGAGSDVDGAAFACAASCESAHARTAAATLLTAGASARV